MFTASYALTASVVLAFLHERLGTLLCGALSLPFSLLLQDFIAQALSELEPRSGKRSEIAQE